MSAIISTNIHDVSCIKTQRRNTNGVWSRELQVICEDGTTLTFALFALCREAATLIELPDEYVQVGNSECTVERSDKPFDMLAEIKERVSQQSSSSTNQETK
jgi:hypothetical protein